MRTQILAVAGALMLSMVAAGECGAQALEANIPFAFQAGNRTMPAGNYRIESMPTGAGSLQVIESADGTSRVTLSTIAEAAPDATAGPELVFHRYGSHCFLAQIQTGDGHARELFPSRQEKEIARLRTRIEVAVVAQATQARQ